MARHFARELKLTIFEPQVPMRGFTIDLLGCVARANDLSAPMTARGDFTSLREPASENPAEKRSPNDLVAHLCAIIRTLPRLRHFGDECIGLMGRVARCQT